MNTTSPVRAIETIFNGIRFRSRLEARFEHEGYQCDGVRYLPDFYLPDLDCFLEIKPSREAFDDYSRKKAKMLSAVKPVYAFCGECGPPILNSSWDETRERNADNRAYSFNSPEISSDRRESHEWVQSFTFMMCVLCQEKGISQWRPPGCDCNERYLLDHSLSPQILAAFAVARSVRFDHPSSQGMTSKDSVYTWVRVWTDGLNDLMCDPSSMSPFSRQASACARQRENPE